MNLTIDFTSYILKISYEAKQLQKQKTL